MVMKRSHLVSMEETHQLSQNARQNRLLAGRGVGGGEGALFGQMVREQVVRLEREKRHTNFHLFSKPA